LLEHHQAWVNWRAGRWGNGTGRALHSEHSRYEARVAIKHLWPGIGVDFNM
jgi:hypothetical protein